MKYSYMNILSKTRKGTVGGTSSGGKLKKLMEGSTIVDLLTLGTLVLNFQLLRDTGYGSSNLMQMPGTMDMLAAQLSAVVIAIYVIEAIIDSAGE